MRVNVSDNPLQAGGDVGKRTGCVSSGKVRKNEEVVIQGGSNMTGTDLCVRLYKSVPVIFEPPSINPSKQHPLSKLHILL